MTYINALISGLLVEQFNMEIMVPQRAKEAPKTSEGFPVSLPVTTQEIKDDMKDRHSKDSKVKLEKTLIHQRQIPGHH